ncbi:MAG: hypothetical protein AAB650_00080 [Patescibacteria group bacterium]
MFFSIERGMPYGLTGEKYNKPRIIAQDDRIKRLLLTLKTCYDGSAILTITLP